MYFPERSIVESTSSEDLGKLAQDLLAVAVEEEPALGLFKIDRLSEGSYTCEVRRHGEVRTRKFLITLSDGQVLEL